MSNPLSNSLAQSLTGENAHVPPLEALDQLTATQARKRPHPKLNTVWEELAHIVYWQDWMLKAACGPDPKIPSSAKAGWPKMPPVKDAAKAWASLVRRFMKGLKEAETIAREKKLNARTVPRGKRTYASLLILLIDHNTYHLGQIVQLRKMMGLWPPPSGGCTW